MSESETSSRVEEELAGFLPSSATVRALQSLFGVLPQTGTLAWYPSIDAAIPEADPATVEAIRDALSSEAVDQVLDVARAVDAGDRSGSFLSGVTSVFSGLFGNGRPSASPQREDAATKLRALAFVIGRLAGDEVEAVVERAAARSLLQYFAIAEVAVPLAEEADAQPGSFVAGLAESDRPADWTRLKSVVGEAGVAMAKAALPFVVAKLDGLVTEILPQATAISAQIEAIVPGGAAGNSLAAIGLDALDAYRWLVARFALEIELERRGLSPSTSSPTPPPPPPLFANPDSTLVPVIDEDGSPSVPPATFVRPEGGAFSRPMPTAIPIDEPYDDELPRSAGHPFSDASLAPPATEGSVNPFVRPEGGAFSRPMPTAIPIDEPYEDDIPQSADDPFADPPPAASHAPLDGSANPFADPTPTVPPDGSVNPGSPPPEDGSTDPFADPVPTASTAPQDGSANPFADASPATSNAPQDGSANPFVEPAPASAPGAEDGSDNPFADPIPQTAAAREEGSDNPFAEPPPVVPPAQDRSNNPFADPGPVASAPEEGSANPFADPVSEVASAPEDGSDSPFADPGPVAASAPDDGADRPLVAPPAPAIAAVGSGNPFADPVPDASVNPVIGSDNPFAGSVPAPSPAPDDGSSSPFADPAPAESGAVEGPASPFADSPVSTSATVGSGNPFADPAPVSSERPGVGSSNPFADPEPSVSGAAQDASPENPFADPLPARSGAPMDGSPDPFADPSAAPPPGPSVNPFGSAPSGTPTPVNDTSGNPFAPIYGSGAETPAAFDPPEATSPFDPPGLVPPPSPASNPFAPAPPAPEVPEPRVVSGGNPFASTTIDATNPFEMPPDPEPIPEPPSAPAVPLGVGPETSGNPFAPIPPGTPLAAGPSGEGNPFLPASSGAVADPASDKPVPPPDSSELMAADAGSPFVEPAAEPPNPFAAPTEPPVADTASTNPFAEPVTTDEPPNPFDAPVIAGAAIQVVVASVSAASVGASPADTGPEADAPDHPFADSVHDPEPSNPFADPIHPATGLMDGDLQPNPFELDREDATEESPPLVFSESALPAELADEEEATATPRRSPARAPDTRLSGDAPPVPPPSLHPQWPTTELPEGRRLRGAFRSPDGLWRIFTKEGIFTDAPPVGAEPIDWDGHWRRGHRVAVYRRDADQATIEYFDAPPISFTVKREQYALRMDGVPWRRADYDLTGRTMQGRWLRDDGMVLTFDHGGRITLGNEQGSYRLGVARIDLTWPDRTEALTLFSTLAPSSKHPHWLWMGGRAYRLQIPGGR